MSDSIFDYPDGVELNKRKQKSAREQKIVIVKEQKLPEEMTRFYDKNKFNFNIMFINVANKEEDLFRLKSDSMCPRKKSSERRANHQQQKSAGEGNWLSQLQEDQDQKRDQHQKQASIEQAQENVPANNMNNQRRRVPEEIQQSQQSLSQQLPQQQFSLRSQPVKISQSISNQQSGSQWAAESNAKQSTSRIEQSAISGLHQITDIKQNQSKKQQMEQNLSQNQQQVGIFKVSDLSSINNSKDYQSYLDLLKRLQQGKQSEEQNINNQQNQIAKLQRSRKQQQINKLPMKKLIYILRTSNCCKICLKVIINPLVGQVKIKTALASNFFNIENPKKKIGESEPKQQIKWEVGKSKIQIQPFAFALTCYSCRNIQNIGILNSEKSCSVICKQSQCKKQIYIEVKKIELQSFNQFST